MSIGTAIVIVGSMFFVVAVAVLVFIFFQWRKMDAEMGRFDRDFAETRDSIRKGARRSDHRFKP